MRSNGLVVAIDGPSGAGKSTAGRALAAQLGYTYIDTGAMYRALALKASRAGVSPMMQRRVLAVMGDGGFWHNGLLTGVQSALFNGDDAVLVIFKNGYTSATGTQEILSTPAEASHAA